MIFYLQIGERLERCYLLREEDISFLGSIRALEQAQLDEMIRDMLRNIRERAAALIVESGQYRIVR